MLRALISSVRSVILSSDRDVKTLRSRRRRTRRFSETRSAVESLEMRTLLSIDPLSLWRPVDHSSLSGSNRVSYLTAADFRTYSLDAAQMQSALLSAPDETAGNSSTVVTLPDPNGNPAAFTVFENSTMSPGLEAQFPEIQTLSGRSVTDPLTTVQIDFSPSGFHAQVLSPSGRWYIDPYFHLDTSVYASYFASSDRTSDGNRQSRSASDSVTSSSLSVSSPLSTSTLMMSPAGTFSVSDIQPAVNRTSGSQLRTYRTAIAATGEYTAFHGGTVAAGQAAIVTALNRLNGIYESELSIRFELVANNNLLVFDNAATDPYTNGDFDALLDQNQATVDSRIGTANYDIGHVFCTAGGGLAQTPSVGIAAFKAQGASGLPQPTGEFFVSNYVAHEIGHQFGADHTFNTNDPNRMPSSAYEPGSGSTIMSYAGVISPAEDLQASGDPYFHHHSFEQIIEYVDVTRPTVGSRTSTGNQLPTVNAGADYVIPTNTPFVLTATGADTNTDDTLTYSWEQHDLGPAMLLTSTQNTTSPLFRVWNPTPDPSRTFPRINELVNNTAPKGERLPDRARTMNFRATVRDNRSGGGGVASDDMVVTVVNTGAAFAVTAPNTAVTWAGGTNQTVTWNVAGTTANGINTANVRILLSSDGGLTYPTVLAASVPNNGTANVQIPGNIATTSARIRVEAIGNVFFDISNTNFTITAAGPAPEIEVLDGETVLVDGSSQIDFGTFLLNDFGNPGFLRGLMIRNTGKATLNLGTISGPAGFIISPPAATQLNPGQSSTVVVEVDLATAGSFSGELNIASNDSDENPFTIQLLGEVIENTPEIEILGPDGVELPISSGLIDLGTIDPFSSAGASFTIRNSGTGALSVMVSDNPVFEVNPSGSAVIAAGDSASYSVSFTSTGAAGTYEGTFSVSNNDADESLYTISVRVTVVDPSRNQAPVFQNPDDLTVLNYQENGLPILLYPNATVTDTDSPNFAGGYLEMVPQARFQPKPGDSVGIRNEGTGPGQIGFNGSSVTFGGVVIGNVLFPEPPTPRIPRVTFNVNATPDAVQALVRNLTFSSTDENPFELQSGAPGRTIDFRFEVEDGQGEPGFEPSQSAGAIVKINAVNDAPVVNAFAGSVTWAAGTALVLLDTDAAVVDPDSANFDTGNLIVQLTAAADASDRLEILPQGIAAGQIGISGSNVTFGGVSIGTFSGGSGAAAFSVNLNSAATPAAVTALLRRIAFRSTAATPPTLMRTVRVSVTDGDGGTSNLPTKTIAVTVPSTGNVAPVIGAFDTPVTYIENGLPVLIDNDATVVDPDSLNFATGKLTVAITANAQTTDRLAVTPTGIGATAVALSGVNVNYGGVAVGAFTGGSGATPLVITFNASATPVAVQAVLRSVSFAVTSDAPSILDRTVRVTLTDGDGGTSNSPTKLIKVTPANDAPVIGAFDTPVTYIENGLPVLIDNNATVVDPDSLNFATGKLTVAITANAQTTDRLAVSPTGTGLTAVTLSGLNVTYGGVIIGTVAGGVGTTPLVITFNTSATPVGVQALLRSLNFSVATDTPSILDRTVRVTLTDGDGGTSNSPTKLIKVTAANDAPVIGAFDTPVTYIENGLPVLIDNNATAVDLDSANLATGKLTVALTLNGQTTDRLSISATGIGATAIALFGTNVTYGGVIIGTVAGGVGTTPLVITFNTSATPVGAQALLRSLNFSVATDAPSILDRTVRVTLTDGDGGTSNSPTKFIKVTPTNDAPVIGAFDTTVTYIENGLPVLIDNNATVVDLDSANLATGKLTVALTLNGQTTDRLSISATGIGATAIALSGTNVTYGGVIIGTVAGGVGTTPLVITFNTSATPVGVQALLRSLNFSLSTDTPSILDRTVRVTLTDGDGGTSNSPTKQIKVTPANDAPVIGAFDAPVNFVAGAAATVLDSDATVTDSDSANMDGGKLTLALTVNRQTTDVLAIRNEGLTAGKIGVNGANITYGGVIIGVMAGGTGTTPLTVTFNAGATPAAVQALIRNLTFRSTAAAPSTLMRTVSLKLEDGDGGISSPLTKNINVTLI